MTDEQQNEKALKVIEAQFQALQSTTGHWQFFVVLADYVRAVTATPALVRHIRLLQQESERAQRVFAMLDTRAMREAMETAKRMVAVVQQAQVAFEPAMRAVAQLQNVMSGSVLAASRIRLFDEHMFDVARTLKEAGQADLVRKYEVHNDPPKNIYGDYVFIPSLDKRNEEEQRIKRARETELWGAWEGMPLIAELLSDPEGFTARLKKEAETDPTKRWQLFNLYGVLGEMNKIRKDEGVRDDDLVFFRVGDFKNRAMRIQAFLVSQVLGSDASTTKASPEFDEKSSYLTFAGKSVLIAKSKNSDPHELLKVIFSDKHKAWTCGDILDVWLFDRDPTKVPKNKVYQAALAVNRKVAEQTTIADFLMVTTKEVRINPQYLDQSPEE